MTVTSPPAAKAMPVPARDFTERLVLHYPGLHLIGAVLLITTALWIGAKMEMTGEGPLWPWRAPAQLTALWSVTLMAFTIFAGSPPCPAMWARIQSTASARSSRPEGNLCCGARR